MTVDPGNRPNPYVALLFSDLEPGALQQLDRRSLGSPEEQIRAALLSYRMLVVNRVKQDLLKEKEVTGASLLRMVDMASEIYMGKFTKLVGPAAIQAYVRAYRNADAGDIPMSTLYALAEQHASRMGTYFNETSKESLAQGFNRYVNARVTSEKAALRALDAYGLTPRQMNSYVALAEPGKVTTAISRPTKAKALEYINRALHQRFTIFAKQEVHNLDQQAQQTAWSWLLDKGAITHEAQKVWMTARDERVCPQCGPMNNQRVLVTDRFKLPNGTEVYVPGVHPNCRCFARLVDLGRVREALSKADWDPQEHPRGGNPSNRGQFSRKSKRFTAAERARATQPRVMEAERGRPVIEPAAVIEEAPVAEEIVLQKPGITLSRAPQMRLGEQIQLSKPEEIVLSREAPTEEPITLSRPQITLGTKEQLSLGTEEEAIGLRRPMQPTEFKPPPAPPPPPPPLPDVEPLPEPVYRVMSPDDVEMSGAYQFSSEHFHAGNEMAAVHQASLFRNTLIHDKWKELTGEGRLENVTIRIFDEKDGVYHQGRITSSDVESVLQGIAKYEDGDDNVKHQNIPIKMYDFDGDWIKSQNFTVFDVAEALDVHPGDFKVFVAEVVDSHSQHSKIGSWDYDSGSRYGDEPHYELSGPYETSDERDRMFSELGQKITIVTLAPKTG